jgi:outer membrane protein assembly factor BamB
VGATAYVGSCAGKVYAFDIATGDTVWTYDVSGDGASQFHSQPIVDDSTITIATDMGLQIQRGNLYAIDRDTGALRWKQSADPGLPADLVADSTHVYTMSHADELLAIDRADGRIAWRFDTTWEYDPQRHYERMSALPRLKSNPVKHGDTIIVAGRDNVVSALSSATGELLWSYPHDSDITTQLCRAGDQVLFGTDAREMIGLHVADGTPVIMHLLDHIPFWEMSWSDPLLVYLAGGDDARPRHVVALDLFTGDTVWDRELQDPDPKAYWYVPRIHRWKTNVIVGSTHGLLVAYDGELGEPVWTHQLEGAIRGIGHTGDTLLVGTFEGMLYALKFP